MAAMPIRYSLFLPLMLPLDALAQQPAPVPVAEPLSTGSMLQVLAGLVLVLMVIAAAAWLLRRFALHPAPTGGAIKVIAGTAVGQRERVVLVEIGSTWLVLGVAPGQVRTLHSMPKAAAQDHGAPPAAQGGFPAWLRQMMEQRNAG